MIFTCRRCSNDFLTESDLHVVIPAPEGSFLECGCRYSNEITKLKKALEIANEAITISANQLEGIGLAFTTHGTNLNVKFMIKNSYENARQAREAQKQIKEVLDG